MADEFLLNLSYTPRQHAGRNGIRLNRAYDVAGALLASGVVTSTTSWTALAVPSGMNTDRGILFMYNLGVVVVRIRSGSGAQFGELRETMGFIPQLVGGKGSSSRGRTPARAGAKRKKQSRDFDRVVTPGPWDGPSPTDQAEMDRLLDKMNSVGLSEAERKRLSELGKRLRGN